MALLLLDMVISFWGAREEFSWSFWIHGSVVPYAYPHSQLGGALKVLEQAGSWRVNPWAVGSTDHACCDLFLLQETGCIPAPYASGLPSINASLSHRLTRPPRRCLYGAGGRSVLRMNLEDPRPALPLFAFILPRCSLRLMCVYL